MLKVKPLISWDSRAIRLATVSITTLIANNCNLHGAIPRLDTIGASGKNLGFKRMVISQTLQTLELSGNWILIKDSSSSGL